MDCTNKVHWPEPKILPSLPLIFSVILPSSPAWFQAPSFLSHLLWLSKEMGQTYCLGPQALDAV